TSRLDGARPCGISPPWCRGRAGQPAHGVTILHAAIAHPLGGGGHAAAVVPKRRDVAVGGGAAFLLRCAPLTHPHTCYTSSVILGLGVAMRRREFITIFAGAATAWPLAARAQQPAKIARIGFLGSTSPSAVEGRLERFRTGLRDLGYVEGQNILIDFRWA